MSKMGGSANRLSSRVSPCSGSPFSATDVTRTLFQNKLYDLVLSNIADPDPRFVLTITRILEEKIVLTITRILEEKTNNFCFYLLTITQFR